jgi:hypothetical protein
MDFVSSRRTTLKKVRVTDTTISSPDFSDLGLSLGLCGYLRLQVAKFRLAAAPASVLRCRSMGE